MSKTSKLMKKVSIALTSGIVISSLTGCGSEPEFVESTDDSQGYYESSQSDYDDTNQVNEVDEETTTDDSLDETDYTDTDYDDETDYTDAEYDDETDYTDTEYDDETEFAYTDAEIPDDNNCNDWEFDYEDNIWICNDRSSSYYRNYFFLGSYFATKSMLHNNNDFTQYKSSGIINGTNSSVKKSGFGSGVSGGIGG